MADPDIRFYDPRDAETGWLANFYRHPFRYEGSDYPTVEHCYQAQKFYACTGNEATLEHAHRIRLAATPREAKTLGQTRDVPMAWNWDEIKLQVMLKVVAAKFCCPVRSKLVGLFHPAEVEMVKKLLQTGYSRLIEASPTDNYWGEGADATGHNHLGRILMAIRDVLPGADHEAMQAYWDVEYTGPFFPKDKREGDLWLWGHRDCFGDDGLSEGLFKRVVFAAWRLLNDPNWDPCAKPPGIQINVITGPLYGQSWQQVRDTLRPWLGKPLQHIWAAQTYLETDGEQCNGETAFVLEAIEGEGAGLLPLHIRPASQGRLGGMCKGHEFVLARPAAHGDGHAYAPWSGSWSGKPTSAQKYWKDLLLQTQWPDSRHELSRPPEEAVAWAVESIHIIPGEDQDDELKTSVPCIFQPIAQAVCLGLRAQDVQGGWLDAWRFLSVYAVTDEGMFPNARWTTNSPARSSIDHNNASVYGTPWKLALIGKSLGALPHIEAAFNKEYAHWAIELPMDAIAERRAIRGMDDGWDGLTGWDIDISFGKDERGEYLDLDSCHRMCGENYVRFHEDGSSTRREEPIAPQRFQAPDPASLAQPEAPAAVLVEATPLLPPTAPARVPASPVSHLGKRGLGVFVALLGSYIGWNLVTNDPKPLQMIIFSVVLVVMGIWMAWRPDDIH